MSSGTLGLDFTNTISNLSPDMTYHYAHSLPDNPDRTQWETLEEHLCRVASGVGDCPGAMQFAESFGAASWGELLGLWHDLGKYSDRFQRYLADSGNPDELEQSGRVDHSTWAAKQACKSFGITGRLLAYVLAGHHAGLGNFEHSGSDGGARSTLRYRLSDANRLPVDGMENVPAELLNRQLTNPALKPTDDAGFTSAFFVRMLFSCLVDADCLWTEHFYDPAATEQRSAYRSAVQTSKHRLDERLATFKSDSPVNQIRSDILQQSRDAASSTPGFFSMHVPTGGGKTLSSLAFALSHAHQHGLRRVIFSIPLTTIIEQTADEFRQTLGDDSVLEVHSNVDDRPSGDAAIARRLASENFDASVIVTTNVQLLESLFANRTSKCRKLHRIAGSVIIFDEVQTLPIHLLRPTMAAMKELVVNYGCSIVLCSATQPAILRRDDFPEGLANVTPIIGNPDDLHERLRRVRVEHVGLMDDEVVADRIIEKQQALCIVNSRRHARALTDRVGEMDNDVFHLSANMCGHHRSEIVSEIKKRLSSDDPCKVISTTVMEAGVDVDFEFVMRAEAGLDSIAQASGRCNREGRRDMGRVEVFAVDPKAYRVLDFVRDGIHALHQIMPEYHKDLLSPAAIEAYFRQYLWRRGDSDRRGLDRPLASDPSETVMGCFQDAKKYEFWFRKAARLYRLIDDAQTSVIVPYGKGADLIRELQLIDEDDITPQWLRSFDRRCRRFTVGAFPHTINQMLANTSVVERLGRFYVPNSDAYHWRYGLDPGIEGMGMMMC